MPGAFVFDPSDSVEGAQSARGRLVADVVALPTVHRGTFVLPSPRIELRHRLPPLRDMGRLRKSEEQCMPRGVCAPSPLSEDPH